MKKIGRKKNIRGLIVVTKHGNNAYDIKEMNYNYNTIIKRGFYSSSKCESPIHGREEFSWKTLKKEVFEARDDKKRSLYDLLTFRFLLNPKDRTEYQIRQDLDNPQARSMAEVLFAFKHDIAGNKAIPANQSPNLFDVVPNKKYPTFKLGRRLNVCEAITQNPINVVLISFFRVYNIGRSPWKDVFTKDITGIPLYEIEAQQKLLWRIFGPLIRLFIRKLEPDEEKVKAVRIGSRKIASDIKWLVGIINPLYVTAVVVDSKGRIRWRGIGDPKVHEVEDLKIVLESLKKEIDVSTKKIKK